MTKSHYTFSRCLSQEGIFSIFHWLRSRHVCEGAHGAEDSRDVFRRWGSVRKRRIYHRRPYSVVRHTRRSLPICERKGRRESICFCSPCGIRWRGEERVSRSIRWFLHHRYYPRKYCSIQRWEKGMSPSLLAWIEIFAISLVFYRVSICVHSLEQKSLKDISIIVLIRVRFSTIFFTRKEHLRWR